MTPDAAPAGAASSSESEGVMIEESARLFGAYAWMEGRLYEVLGALSADEPVARLAVLLDAHSQQHAWHAELLAGHIPLLAGRDPEGFVVAPRPEVAEVFDGLGKLPGGAPRAAALARVVLPRLVTGYRLHLTRARAVSDAPSIRSLRLVAWDEVEAQLEMEAVLEGLLSGVADPETDLEEAGRLEALVAGSGPGFVPREPDQGT